MTKKKSAKKGLLASVGGAIIFALCCFTPLLVVLLGLIGFAALTPYLDYALFPGLGIFIISTIYFFTRWLREKKCCQPD